MGALVAMSAVGLFTVGQAAALADSAPEAPQNIAGVALHYGMVSLDWDDVTNADSYEIEYFDGHGWLRLPSAAQGIVAIFDGSSVILDGLENERRVEVRVRAVNSAAASEWSGIYSMPATATVSFSGVPRPRIDGTPAITSAGPYEVDEGATSIAALGAEDFNTAESDLVWSVAGGADAARFVLSESGVLAFGAAKDYEEPDDADADGTYELTVKVSDGTSDDTAEVSVTLENVIELEAVEGPSAVSFAESSWSRVATFTASSSQDRDGITWTLGGDDAAHFSIDDPSGALRFDLDPVAPVIVAKPPDFEAPVDSGNDNAYAVTLLPSSGSATAASALSVTVTVTDADEDGAVSLSTKRPRTGVAVTAALSDPDGVVDGSATWVWERSVGYGEWATITGADSSSYTPVAAECGQLPAGRRVLQRQPPQRRASPGDGARGGGGCSAQRPVGEHRRLGRGHRRRRLAADAAGLRRADAALLRGLQRHRHDDVDDAPRRCVEPDLGGRHPGRQRGRGRRGDRGGAGDGRRFGARRGCRRRGRADPVRRALLR